MAKKLKQSLFKNTILHVRLLLSGRECTQLLVARENRILLTASFPSEKFHLRIKCSTSQLGIISFQTTTKKKYKIYINFVICISNDFISDSSVRAIKTSINNYSRQVCAIFMDVLTKPTRNVHQVCVAFLFKTSNGTIPSNVQLPYAYSRPTDWYWFVVWKI